MVTAKSHRALVKMGRLFEERKVEKRYRAIVVGELVGEGEVLSPVEGRNAHTRYRAVSHNRALKTQWQTTVDLWPLTGRTHQLRRHMAELGHPILGDSLYGGDAPVLKGKGLFLRAIELQFPHPIHATPMVFSLEEPSKFENQRLREARRWRQFREDKTASP